MYSMYGYISTTFKSHLARQPRLHVRRIQFVHHLLHAFEQGTRNELIGVVFGEGDARTVALVVAPREIVGNLDHGGDESGAEIIDRLR